MEEWTFGGLFIGLLDNEVMLPLCDIYFLADENTALLFCSLHTRSLSEQHKMITLPIIRVQWRLISSMHLEGFL